MDQFGFFSNILRTDIALSVAYDNVASCFVAQSSLNYVTVLLKLFNFV